MASLIPNYTDLLHRYLQRFQCVERLLEKDPPLRGVHPGRILSATGFFRVIANTYVLFVFNGLFGNKTGNDVMRGMIAVRKFLYGVRWMEHD